jgi:hypothetical protein
VNYNLAQARKNASKLKVKRIEPKVA